MGRRYFNQYISIEGGLLVVKKEYVDFAEGTDRATGSGVEVEVYKVDLRTGLLVLTSPSPDN